MPKILDGTPVEPTHEELDIAEMSASRTKKIDTTLSIKIDNVATTAVDAGLDVAVIQSVRNHGNVTVHLDQKLSRIFGQSKCWTEKKIYQQFGKQYTETLKSWDAMCNVLAITDIPEDVVKPVELINP